MKYLSYRDVSLVPRHSSLPSRDDANTELEFLGRNFFLPVVPANMKDVIDVNIAKDLANNGFFYIMHRWFSPTNNTNENAQGVIDFIQEMNKEEKMVSVSIGVGVWWGRVIEIIREQGMSVDYMTIDVAHADHDNVNKTILDLKTKLPKTKLIVGNVATAEGCEYLIKQGVDAVKVGIGGGRICTTRNKTGFHVPMFSCVLQCQPMCEKYNIPMIADGGVEEFGDIAKALVAGATMVMAGGIFAECIDSPAAIINGQKEYRGSTSYAMKGKNNHIEGKTINMSYSVKYSERICEITQALQSSISYGGGKDLSCFNLVEYITV
jgi:GMP reductase